MLFLVVCHDLPGSEALRTELMPKHGPYIKPFLPNFAIGGWLTQGGPTCGSAIIFEGPSREAVEAIFRGDPYFGTVWRAVDVYDFQALIGQWIGKTSFN